VLELAAAGAELIDVGKEPDAAGAGARGRGQEQRQAEIARLLVEHGRRRAVVVRLKGGDPFVFGRGGEEALALAAAGIPFEVIPGISSAIAAPGLAGIPVTHRGLTSGFLVVSGHDEQAYFPVLSSVAPNSVTVVILMGLGTRARVAQLLIERGWRAQTPAAILLDASRPSERTWSGDLAGLGAAPIPNGDAPGTLCIGDVVSLAQAIGPARSPAAFEAETLTQLTGSR
jgi:uroporphyrin-III C-methyltransferase / precorrin-2 dehydrogenase / sirohydrochlorin ferrochelatase